MPLARVEHAQAATKTVAKMNPPDQSFAASLCRTIGERRNIADLVRWWKTREAAMAINVELQAEVPRYGTITINLQKA